MCSDPYTSSSYTSRTIANSIIFTFTLSQFAPTPGMQEKTCTAQESGQQVLLMLHWFSASTISHEMHSQNVLSLWMAVCLLMGYRFTSMHSSHITQHLVSKWGVGLYCMCVFMYKHVLYIYHAGSLTAAVC